MTPRIERLWKMRLLKQYDGQVAIERSQRIVPRVWIWLCLTGLGASYLATSQHAVGQTHSLDPEAMVVLRSDSISAMLQVKHLIKEKGGRIHAVFPPKVIVGTLPQRAQKALAESSLVQTVALDSVHDPILVNHTHDAVRQGCRWWNEKCRRKHQPKAPAPHEHEKEGQDEIQCDEGCHVAEATPTPEQLKRQEENYLRQFHARQRQLKRNSTQRPNRQRQIRRDVKRPQRAARRSQMAPSDAPQLVRAPSSFEPSNNPFGSAPEPQPFGPAFGAGFNDTDLFFMGEITVSVFFVPGDDGPWNTQDINVEFQNVVSALDVFVTSYPNARLSFTYLKQVDENGLPKSYPSDALGEHVNQMRSQHHTHWAFAIEIRNEFGRARARAYNIVVYKRGSERTVRHETMHMFGAADQYTSARRSPTQRHGYMNVVNANSAHSDGTGFFNGAGEGNLSDLMITSRDDFQSISPYSRGQVGWIDQDGDGILDPMDTYAIAAISASTGNNPFTLTGISEEKPLPTELHTSTYSSVSINTVQKVEYRINDGPWLQATPTDGQWGPRS